MGSNASQSVKVEQERELQKTQNRVLEDLMSSTFILENVAAILNRLGHVLRDIYESRVYECEWATFPASSLGACHQSDRWLLGVAYPNDNGSDLETRNRSYYKGHTDGETELTDTHENLIPEPMKTCQSERSSESRKSVTY